MGGARAVWAGERVGSANWARVCVWWAVPLLRAGLVLRSLGAMGLIRPGSFWVKVWTWVKAEVGGFGPDRVRVRIRVWI